MESQRYLRCLGQPALFTATGEPIRFRTRKHLALLVYLAVEQRTQRRDRLAELLWPRVSATEARHSLATALSAKSAPMSRLARARASSGGRCALLRPLCASENATWGRESAMRVKASSQRANSVASLFRNLRRAGVLK